MQTFTGMQVSATTLAEPADSIALVVGSEITVSAPSTSKKASHIG